MRTVYKAVTSDIINRYAFGESEGNIDKANYNAPHFLGLENIQSLNHVSLQFGWLYPLVDSLPSSLATWAVPVLLEQRKKRKVLIPIPPAITCI